jgi:CubicO group peptidase (beta-lactamase class C family)
MSHPAADLVDALVAAGAVPGMALVIADGDGLLVEHVAGSADRDGTVPVAPDTRFALASLTKPLVAMAALVAAEEGIVDLDAPLATLIDGVAPTLTLRNTLAHYSGLPESVPADALGVSSPCTWDELRHGYASVAQVATAGVRRLYSNPGYALAGAALEAASGIGIADYVRESVLEPLGMANTSLGLAPGIARAWVRDAGLWARGIQQFNTPWLAALPLPQSAAWSTARDYAAFLACVLRGGTAPGGRALIAPETCAELVTNQGGALAGGVESFMTWARADWALGFEIRAEKERHWTGASLGPRALTHFGSAGTLCVIDPDRARVIAVLANRGTYSGWMMRADAWPAIVRSS